MSDIMTLIMEVKSHDVSATPGPWHPQRGAIRVDLPGPITYTWALAAYPKDVALIAHYRTAAPILALEVERLNIALEHSSVKTCPRCEDFANDARKVMSEQCAPDGLHCSCVPHLRAEVARLTAECDELRLTLLAELGDVAGAPEGWTRTGWLWWRPLGPPNHQAEVRRANIHPDGDPWQWALYTPTLTAEGYALTAREAMLRADKAHEEKA